MNKNIGFIGCGNMGSAMISGIVKAEIVPSDRIYVCDHHENNFDKVVQRCTLLLIECRSSSW